MLNLLLGFETGTHVDHPMVDVFRAKELKLVPHIPGEGFIAIDGEVMPSQEIHVQVAPSLATVFVNK